MNTHRKWQLIEQLSAMSDRGGDLLLALMDYAGAANTMTVTEAQVEAFCRERGIRID